MNISFEQFKEAELVVADVLEAERVPDTDKLLKLTIDAGEEAPRTIVSGIAEYYKPEALIGTQITIVKNLEPKAIKGITSEGMILAVREEDSLALIVPSERVAAGSRIS